MKKHFSTPVVIVDGQRMVSETVSPKRAEVQAEINQNKVDIDYATFAKTQAERDELKIEKAHYKLDPEKRRNEFLSTFIDSKLPNWNLTFIVK
jgi:hypothetical protein